YADGYPWHLSNRGAAVLVHGKRCLILGRVTMDLMVIDVSEFDDVQVGDDVVLMGRDGTEEISCAELGERAGTITWVIITRIGTRVRRGFFLFFWFLLALPGGGRKGGSDQKARETINNVTKY